MIVESSTEAALFLFGQSKNRIFFAVQVFSTHYYTKLVMPVSGGNLRTNRAALDTHRVDKPSLIFLYLLSSIFAVSTYNTVMKYWNRKLWNFLPETLTTCRNFAEGMKMNESSDVSYIILT
jgi:hypothetical protein